MKMDWSKGLLPAIVQDEDSKDILMVGYMNEQALQKTLEFKKVVFFSRSKNRLWMKGETSGHFLDLVSIKKDCDSDAILIKAEPRGPTCHRGSQSCFNNFNLESLEDIISEKEKAQEDLSYTKRLLKGDEDYLIQKVGEEAVEVVLASKQNQSALLNEMADLFYHSLVLLKRKKLCLADVEDVLFKRSLVGQENRNRFFD